MRKGITPLIAAVMVLLITVSVTSMVWLNMSSYLNFYAEKLISKTREQPFCTRNSVTMNIVNTGNSDIELEESLADFFSAGNLLENSNFENDLRIDWEIPIEHLDIMLLIDRSGSMVGYSNPSLCFTPCDAMGYDSSTAICSASRGESYPDCHDCDGRNPSLPWNRRKDDIYPDHSVPDNIHYEDNCPFNEAKAGALSFLKFVDDSRDRVGIVSFSRDTGDYSNGEIMADLEIGMTDDMPLVLTAIDTMYVGGMTGIAAAIRVGTMQFDANPRDSKKVMILLTDGHDSLHRVFRNGALVSPQEEAQNAADKGIEIFTIGYGPSADNGVLEQIAMITGADNYTAATEDELKGIYENIASELFANIDNHESTYGNRSLRLPAADGASFNSRTIETGNDLMVSQYIKLKGLTSGSVNCSIHFYETQAKADSYTPDLQIELFNYTAPQADFDFTKHTFVISKTDIDDECNGNPCQYGRIFYQWSSGSPAGDVWVDDLYMGYHLPYLEAISPREARLGDLTIIKSEGDGDLYPYVSSSVVESNNFTYIRDANCISQNCEYIITTGRSNLDLQGTCK